MKIKEFISTPKPNLDTTSSGTIYSISSEPETQDLVPQDNVPEKIVAEMVDNEILEMPDHSAIAEGVSQIFRRQKGGKPTKGFRCASGPRKGRIVAKPSTCFQRTDPQKSAKIRKKRQRKAAIAGVKLARTKRAGAGSLRLKGAQIKRTKGTKPLKKSGKKLGGSKSFQKSKTVRVKK